MKKDMGSTVSEIPMTGTFRFFEDVLNAGLDLRVRVTGRSMAPFLKGGEVLTIKKVDYASLKKGDLIFFKNLHGSPLLHRLIKKKNVKNNTFMFHTKGDALITFDEPVCEHEILGKVHRIEKIVSYGRTKSINMESYLWRNINFIIASVSVIKSKAYFAVHRIYRIKQLSFMKPSN